MLRYENINFYEEIINNSHHGGLTRRNYLCIKIIKFIYI